MTRAQPESYIITHRNQDQIVLVNFYMNAKLQLRSSSQTSKKSDASHYTLMADTVRERTSSTPQELDRNTQIMYEKSFLITRFACVIMFATAFCVFLISLINYFEIFSNTTVQTNGNLLFYCRSFNLQVYWYSNPQICMQASRYTTSIPRSPTCLNTGLVKPRGGGTPI